MVVMDFIHGLVADSREVIIIVMHLFLHDSRSAPLLQHTL